MKRILLLLGMVISINAFSQDELEKALAGDTRNSEKVSATFKSTKLINLQTNETIHKGELDFRVDHRFGDIAGDNGGIRQFFGLDNSTDVRIGFDYGLSDRLTAGIARSKGATLVQQLYELSLKFRLVEQNTNNKIPVSITLFASNTIAAVSSAGQNPSSAIAYKTFPERMNYVSQLIIAKKFNSRLSLTVIPSYVHRNYTAFRDQNDLFALGAGGRLKLSKWMSLVVDYMVNFRNPDDKNYLEELNRNKFYNPLGAGLEMETGGHVFHLNFTNATAIQEMQFIPETTSSWTKGQYRWGFSISRRFSFQKTKQPTQ